MIVRDNLRIKNIIQAIEKTPKYGLQRLLCQMISIWADIPSTTLARTCENINAIDVRELQRKKLLRPDCVSPREVFRDGVPSGDILIMNQPDAILLLYRVHPPGAPESRVVEQRVRIVWTKCRLGGRRPWFKCLITSKGDLCGRRVAKIYGPSPLFACRHCLGLVYESQREPPVDRAMHRAQMIKMRLGGSNDPLEPFPQKPRRMHWRTYKRLREQACAADANGAIDARI
jgi:hypothetical protein